MKLKKSNILRIIVFSFMVLLIFTCQSYAEFDRYSGHKVSNVNLGLAFPPIRTIEQIEFTEPHLETLNVSYIRFSEHWEFREPTQGAFSWAPLDYRLDFAESKGLKVLLTIESMGPDWAIKAADPAPNSQSAVFKNDADFTNYLSQLFHRYKNRINKVHFGNEWQAKYWYVGTSTDYVNFNNIMYDVVKASSPQTQVVLGAFSCGSLRMLAAKEGLIDSFYDIDGNYYDQDDIQAYLATQDGIDYFERVEYVLANAKFDILDIHLYDDPERWHLYYNYMKGRFPDKEIIVSEFGGPNHNVEVYSDDYYAQRVHDYIKKLDELGINEAYYFKLVESSTTAHIKSGLMNLDLSTKKSV
ncbi:hypothetical protein ACFLUV_05365 [Elusimicrobiota bacterium]